MTLPLFYTNELTTKSGGQLVGLDAAASSHAIRSQRLATGDEVLIADGAGLLAQGRIEHADAQHAMIRVDHITHTPAPPVRINLVQALAKNDRDLLAAEMATEIGVDAVTPWQAHRSIVRLRPERSAKTLAKWEAKLQAAAQQARRATIPQLHDPISGTDIANLHRPAQGHHVMVLHETGHHELATALPDLEALNTLHVVVGPEGGVSPEECAAVADAGGAIVKIGQHIMRASTAGPVAIALLNQLCARW